MHNIKKGNKLNVLAAAVIATGILTSGAVSAAEVTATLEEVVVVGSRGAPRSVAESPVPVDVINADELGKAGSNDLLMQLQGAVPSLNVHLQPISDAASMIRPANLRGLPSDNTLIMVNGKRRHRASVIAFLGGGTNDGAQGPDISVIPSIALKQVEVLRDGASAQYGSDAIAGVINFVLNDASEGGSLMVKQGEFQAGDGATRVLAGNIGLPLTDDGFVNLSFQMKDNEATSRSLQRPDAQLLIDNGNTAVADPAQIWGAPKVDDDVTFFFNSGLDLGNGGEAYLFGNYSERDIDGGFYYRNPDGRGGVFTNADGNRLIADVTGDLSGDCPINVDPSDYVLRDEIIANPNCYIHNQIAPGGYTPRFIGNIADSSITIGTRGDITGGSMDGVHYDISGSVGRNESRFGLNNTINPSLGPDTQRDFDTGGYTQLAKALNIDLQKQYGQTSVAGGVEWRETTFSVTAGEEASWIAGDYALQGFNVGSHGFPGFSPASAGDFTRRNYAFYGDIESQITDNLLVGGALRYEDYTTFGDTTNYKLTFNYQLLENLALRGSHSTGFRAPTQGQANVVNSSTTLVDGELVQAQVLPSFQLGEGQLQPEESTSFALGAVLTFGELEVTVDAFQIAVDDRLSLTVDAAPTSSQIAAMEDYGIPNPELLGSVKFFANDFNTETSGFDLVATYATELLSGTTDFSAALNYTKTEVSDVGQYTDELKIDRLEKGLPNYRATFTMVQEWDRFNAFVRANYFGDYYAVHVDGIGTDADAAVTIDMELAFTATERLSFSIGGQNIFNQDAERLEGSKGMVDAGLAGNNWGGVFYETSPFGIEGAFWYAKSTYSF